MADVTELLRLTGRNVIVTGAGGKVGATVTATLASAGANVIGIDNDDAALGRLRTEGHCIDVTDESAMRAFVDGRPIDALVCLVGGVHAPEFGPAQRDMIRTYDAIVDRNLRSAVVPHQIVAESMIAAGRGGSIVTITAATAFASAPFHGMYGAAKAALIALARTEAVEWGRYGIRVNTVAPGGIETIAAADPDAMRRAEAAAVPLGRRARPADIAHAVLFLLSDLASYVTGHTLVLDGGALGKPAFLDADNVPVFITDKALRERIRSDQR